MTQDGRVLTVIVCGAGPASEVGQLVGLAQEHGWTVQVVATPAALDFLDVPAIEALTGSPVRSQYRKPGEPRSRPADAIIVAPATYNTINKWAQGISDTYALGAYRGRRAARQRPDTRDRTDASCCIHVPVEQQAGRCGSRCLSLAAVVKGSARSG